MRFPDERARLKMPNSNEPFRSAFESQVATMTEPTTTLDTPGTSDERQNIRFSGKDAALRADVHALGSMVGELLLEQGGEALYKTVESARQFAIARREGDAEAGERLNKLLSRMSATAARDIVRAFSTYFQVVNTAEQVHRIRRRRDYLKDTENRQPRALDTTVFELRDAGFDAAATAKLLQQIHIEPVFTPHPTETTRRTILRKHQNIVRRMVDMQNPALTPHEVQACFESIRADITAIWQTEESPTTRTTIFDELEHTLFFLTDVIYRVIPPFYEALKAALKDAYAADARFKIPNMLSFASWIGGDASTNPEISARVIRDTMARQRSLILDLYYKDCRGLAEKLSQSVSRIDVDSAINERIDAYSKQFPQVRGSMLQRYRNMPYRMLLRLVCQRLQATYDDRAFPYETVEQFIDDLQLIAKSLTRRKGANAGLFAVERLIRRAETFGFHFLSLDVRYSARDLQTAVGYCLGEKDWLAMPSDARAARIEQILRVNDSPVVEPDNNAKRLLSVFRALIFCRRKYGRRAIGAFLVRHCKGIDDVFAALLLGRWAGMHDSEGAVPLDVVPAFETGDELRDSAKLIGSLLGNEMYKAHLASRNNQQIVMLSASGLRTDGGVAASRWNMQQAHRQLGKLFNDAGVDFTLFHGRGTFSGRGGVLDSIAGGHLRATEHGESVNERYGVRGIAFRTLEKAFNAVVMATAELDETPADLGEWQAVMELIAARGNEALGDLDQDEAAFDNYFRLVTPIDVIERMRLGHNTLANIEDEIAWRNIPWSFAWAQSRFVLPTWYGFGAGLEAAIQKHGIATVRDMIDRWPFFNRLVMDVETAVAVADLGIASQYSLLSGSDLHQRFFPGIEAEHKRTVRAILDLRQCRILLENSTTLRRSIRLRNPYVDPMSLLQVELLRRWRSGDRSDAALQTALIASVNGIARGLQTSG